jgi:acetyl-CoA carboxylase carboxyltransferase component
MSSMPAGPGGASAKLDAETQARVESEQRAGPWRLAAGMSTDDVIDPRELRNAILAGLALAAERLRRPAPRPDEWPYPAR